MQSHPRPSQEIAEAMAAHVSEMSRLDAATLVMELAGDYPQITRLELRGTGGDKALAQVVSKALETLP
jgi:hypothetical protein